MKYIRNKYTLARSVVLSKNGCKKFFKFASLPELKICKTAGFIASILL